MTVTGNARGSKRRACSDTKRERTSGGRSLQRLVRRYAFNERTAQHSEKDRLELKARSQLMMPSNRLVTSVKWSLNRDKSFLAVPTKEKALISSARRKRSTAHGEAVPLVLIQGYPKVPE